jgi:hypothetical protein
MTDGLKGFCEIKGCTAINRVSHFGGMFRIVAPNTENAVYWKNTGISINTD